MSGVTAVVLSAGQYTRRFHGLEVLVRQQEIRDAAQLQRARFDAVLDVETPFFFFLDDDDDLPEDHLKTVYRCVRAGAAVAYTDEIIRLPDGSGVETARRPYSQHAHIDDPLLVHHLAVCDTEHAKAAVRRLPRGHYCPEFMLYWELAKSSAAYVAQVGYVWHKKPTGMHKWPCTTLSQMYAVLWAKENR